MNLLMAIDAFLLNIGGVGDEMGEIGFDLLILALVSRFA